MEISGMRTCKAFILSGSLFLVLASETKADEFGFSSYGLGGAAFGAGVTPPPGTYITTVSGYYEGKINAPVTLGGVTLDIGSRVQFFQEAINGLYVPNQKLFGANVGVSVTVPVGHIDLKAGVTGPLGNTIEERTSGGGLGDVSARVQLGWQEGDFAQTAYIAVVTPTGRYETGFNPNIGLNRPGIDIGWAFTWTEKTTKLQFNSAFGITYNFENQDTDYESGTDFHYEWAIGREVATGLVIGVVGYDYRQLTGDSGSGARLGSLEGSVDAIGGGIQYTTIANGTPIILNARHYEEFDVEKRWSGSMTILSGTLRY
jgi:hypothetical protein